MTHALPVAAVTVLVLLMPIEATAAIVLLLVAGLIAQWLQDTISRRR